MKNAKIFLRMDAAMKQRLDDEATRRGESVSLIIREALRTKLYGEISPGEAAVVPVIYPRSRGTSGAEFNEPARKLKPREP
jgi:hypothetical protein